MLTCLVPVHLECPGPLCTQAQRTHVLTVRLPLVSQYWAHHTHTTHSCRLVTCWHFWWIWLHTNWPPILLDSSLIISTFSGDSHVYLARDLYGLSSFFPITLERWHFWQKQKERFSSAIVKVPSKDEMETKKPLGNGKPRLPLTNQQTPPEFYNA